MGQRGFSKDHRPELRQMVVGTVIDDKGRPICCEMWPGDTADVKTLIPVVERMCKRFGIGQFCIVAGWRQLHWVAATGVLSPMEALTKSMAQSAADSVELALGLIGVMTLFLGLVKVAEAGGLLRILAHLIRPLMIRLFPDVPPEHPAMGAMILNMSANAMGLGNAATPLGIRAMQELDKLNGSPGTATDSIALFPAINTSSVTLLPTGVIALRAAAGSADPAGILPTTLFATLCSTMAAIFAAKLYARFFKKDRPP